LVGQHQLHQDLRSPLAFGFRPVDQPRLTGRSGLGQGCLARRHEVPNERDRQPPPVIDQRLQFGQPPLGQVEL
jgi:hypothetical protein